MADDVVVTGLDEWIGTLAEAYATTPREAGRVVGRGAFNTKKDWQQRWSGLAHAPALPRAVGYDTTVRAAEATAEIGPDKDKPQGALGNLVDFGSVHNAPTPGGLPALDAEAPRFEAALADLATQLLGGTA